MNAVAPANSELRYRRLFEAAFDGILIVDPATRAILEVNPFLTRLLGYGRDELVGKELFQIGLLQDESASRAAFQELQRSGYIRYDGLPLRAKDGRQVDVEFVSNVYEEGERQVIQCNIRDITARKRTERERRALSAERARITHDACRVLDSLRREQAEMDHFLAALWHELRTPLNPVLLLAGAAVEDPETPAPTRAIFAEIVKNVEAEARLIDDLQDLARIANGKMPLARQVVDVHDALHDALRVVRPDCEEKGLIVRVNLAAGNRSVLADPLRLQQIFWNLLRNAAKFSQPGGQITIETMDVRPDIIRIRVADTGLGMTEAELGRLFVSFAQGDHATANGSLRFGGMGLGLSIAKMLVGLHAGTIRAESAGRNCGSTFLVDLPVFLPSP